jgi:hypothetical protein
MLNCRESGGLQTDGWLARLDPSVSLTFLKWPSDLLADDNIQLFLDVLPSNRNICF